MSATRGAVSAYPSGAPEFTFGFSSIGVDRSLVLICNVLLLAVCPFTFGHCVFCPSSI